MINTKRTFNEQYDFLCETIGVSTEALDLAYGIGGCSEETTNNILQYYTGYHSIDQYIECEMKEEEE